MAQDIPSYSPGSTLEWDEKAIMACVCDGGFFGPDCSLRKCPFADDPVTVCDQNSRTEQVQRVEVSVNFDMSASSADTPIGMSDRAFMTGNAFSLSFMTPTGVNFTTRRIDGLWGTQSSNYISGSEVTGAAAGLSLANLETAIESLPNFAVRDVSVTKNTATANANEALISSFDVTFHHEQDGQNSYGIQYPMWCHIPNSCAGPGCQPRVEQAYALGVMQNDGDGGSISYSTQASMNAALTYNAGALSANNFVRVNSDSVLHCPTGKNCATTGRDTFSAGVGVVIVGSATDNAKVFIKPVGGVTDSTYLQVDASNEPMNTWEGTADLDKDTLVAKGFSFAGELTSSNRAKFGIADFVPGTWLSFASGLEGTNNVNAGAVVMWKTATCTVSDWTESAAVNTAFSNADIENAECAGRGTCDRSSGLCSCYKGYHGVACERQTVLV